MFTLRAVQSRYAAKMPLYDGIAMGVLIQPMVSLSGHAYAFIAFSKDAVAKNDKAVYIEMCTLNSHVGDVGGIVAYGCIWDV